jgi:hypothetical protein
MPLTVVGRNVISALIVSTGSMRPWGATGAYFVVGNSTATHATSQTFTQGAATTMAAMDAGYPTRSTNVCISNSTTTALAAGDAILNRKVEDPSLGTKTSAQSWQITADITFTT